MADEQFGNLGPKDFDNLRSAAAEVANLAAEQQRALSSLGESTALTTNALQQQARAARDLAGFTAEELKSKNALNTLENRRTQSTQSLAKLQQEEARRIQKVEQLQQAVTRAQDRALTASVANERTAKANLVLRQRELTAAQEGLDITRQGISSSKQLLKSTEDLIQAKKVLDSQTRFFDKLESAVKAIPAIGEALSGPFTKASAAAKEAAEKGVGKMNANLAGGKVLATELAAMLGPAAVLGALFKVSDQVSQINRQLGLGTEAAARTRDRFSQIADQSNSSRFNTEKLLKANLDLNQALGTSVEFSGDVLKSFIELTQYMGVSAEAAGKLATLGKITGQTSNEFAGNLAQSVAQSGKANGIFISTASAFEKIKNLSGTTLLNLRRNPEAIGQAIIATEKLGISFDQLRSTASSLLDFESSISNELEAELLTGKQLNLERARSAALRGDDVALARELAQQVGNVAQFEKMNVIQRESMAKAFGMSSDQMSDMLIKQELMNKLGNEAKDLSDEQARAVKDMMDKNPGMNAKEALLALQTQESATQKFQDAVAKLRTVFTDLVSFLSPVLDKFGSFISSFASSGLGKAIMGGGIVASLMLALKNMIMPRGSSMANPLFVSMSAGGSGMFSGLGITSADKAAMVRQTGSASAAREAIMRNRGVGLGAVAGLAGGMMMTSENEGMQIGGAALSGAGTGAMIGSAIPVIGTLAGAGIGAAIGGLTAYLNKKDAEEEKNKKTQDDSYSEMIKLLRMQAEKDVDIYMDSNKVGQQIVIGGYQTNSKINHT